MFNIIIIIIIIISYLTHKSNPIHMGQVELDSYDGLGWKNLSTQPCTQINLFKVG